MELAYPFALFREDRLIDTDHWLQVTQEQIRKLFVSLYAAIGSRGYYHNILAHISTNDTAQEMTRSKEYAERIFFRPANSFVFPYGIHTCAAIEQAKNEYYNPLLAMDFHFGDDNADVRMRKRVTIDPFISPINQMRAIITKGYER